MFFWLSCHLYTAEEADSTVWYTLMAYFPSSSSSYCFSGEKKQNSWLPDITISTNSAHFCVWVCEVKYAWLCYQCQLSFVPLSPQCKDKGWTIPQGCIDKGWWKQLNGQNTGPCGLSADLYGGRCTSPRCASLGPIHWDVMSSEILQWRRTTCGSGRGGCWGDIRWCESVLTGQTLTLVCLYSLMAERSSSDTSSCISTNALWLPESFWNKE